VSESALTINVDWTKHDNFFELWRAHRRSTKLLYVIGEHHHCYVGCIGGKSGQGGLAQRYQWQYVNRARSIFGRDEADGQVAYSGEFRNPESITPELILAAEADVQSGCVLALGPDAVLFDPEDTVDGLTVRHLGTPPIFLTGLPTITGPDAPVPTPTS
jgi:hypothetical protein